MGYRNSWHCLLLAVWLWASYLCSLFSSSPTLLPLSSWTLQIAPSRLPFLLLLGGCGQWEAPAGGGRMGGETGENLGCLFPQYIASIPRVLLVGAFLCSCNSYRTAFLPSSLPVVLVTASCPLSPWVQVWQWLPAVARSYCHYCVSFPCSSPSLIGFLTHFHLWKIISFEYDIYFPVGAQLLHY